MSFCPDYIDFMDDSYEGEKYIEATAVESEPMKDVVILSIEKYDKMKADLVKLGKDLEVTNRDKEHCLDILKKIRITEEHIDKMLPGSFRMGTCRDASKGIRKFNIRFDISDGEEV